MRSSVNLYRTTGLASGFTLQKGRSVILAAHAPFLGACGGALVASGLGSFAI